jgi:hypothetical protein
MSELILSEIAQMSKNVTDLGEIASHINRVHKTKYTANDILRIQNGKAPRHKPKFKDNAPIVLHESNAKSAPPIGWVPPISTGTKDPLVVALKAYQAKYADKITEALQRGY